jgi:hypothetical protein
MKMRKCVAPVTPDFSIISAFMARIAGRRLSEVQPAGQKGQNGRAVGATGRSV